MVKGGKIFEKMENETENIMKDEENFLNTIKSKEKSLSYIREKWNHAGFQKYFRNMGWAFLGRAYGLIGSFFIGILVARYLGPEKYGVLNYVTSFVTVFSFLASFGIDNILVRDLVKSKENKEPILNTAFSLRIIGAISVIFIICMASLIFHNTGYITALIFIYSLMLLSLSINVLEYFFQSEVKYKYIFWGQIISVSSVYLLRLYLIHSKLGTGWFIISLIFESLVYTLIMLFIFRKKYNSLKLRIDFSFAKKLISDSWPFVFTTAFALIYSKIDQVMIGKMLDNHSLGIYSAGVKLAEIWYFIPVLICGVVLPSIISAYKSDTALYKKRTRKLFQFITGLTALFALFEFVFAKFIIFFIFGKAYAGSVGVLQVYTWAGVFIAMIITMNQTLTVENRTRLIMISSCASAGINILLNLIFIPKFGIIGSAWATFFSYASMPLIISLANKRYYKNAR